MSLVQPPRDDPRAAPVAPPVGPPWDSPLAEAPLAFVDLEMTGLDPASDRVVEICVVRVVGGREVERLETLVRPDVRAGGNAHIHGLDAAKLADAPPFAELAERVHSILEGAVLVAHGAAWDVAFLEAELARASRPLAIPHYVDTLTLSRRALGLASHSLKALAEALGVPQREAHRAGDDVRVLCAIFDRLVRDLEPRTPRDLWHVRIGARHARPEVVAACERAVASGEPVTLTLRPARRAARTLDAVLTAVRADLDPPRVLGYQLPGRGRFEHRADRILSVHPRSAVAKATDATEASPTRS